MRKIFAKYYLDVIILALLTGLTIYTVFHLTSHLLLADSAVNLWDSLVFYFRSLFSDSAISTEGVNFLEINESLADSVLPLDFEVFGTRFLSSFELLVNPDNISGAWSAFLPFINNACTVIMIIMLPAILAFVMYYVIIFSENKKTSFDESRPLSFWRKVGKCTVAPVAKFLVNLWKKFKSNKWYFWIGLILLAYNLNLFSIVLIALAWCFYFVFSIDFVSIYYLFVKILICLSPLFHPVFWAFWIVGIISLVIFLKLHAGTKKVKKLYQKDIDVVESAGVSLMLIGGPGAGKGSCGEIIHVADEHLLRTKAANLMMEIRLEFPDFPWREIESLVENRTFRVKTSQQFKNKVQVEMFFKKKFDEDHIWSEKKDVFKYSLKTNKIYFYDSLKQVTILEEIVDYAQLYFIYISKLTESNFSIRVDQNLKFDGHFANYKHEPWKTDPRDIQCYYYSKIIDMNQMRILAQIADIDDDIKKQTALFDAGLIYVSEYEKERGNRFTNLNRKDYDVKPGNDGVQTFIALFRHLTTVRNVCFGRMLMDGQDLSLMAGRESQMVETIAFIQAGKRKTKLTVPLFFVENTILQWFDEHFSNRVEKYKDKRNDKTVYSWIHNHLAGFFRKLNRKLIGTYGYESVPMSLSAANLAGSQGSKGDVSFNLLYKIAYASKFKTDCYSDYWKKTKEAALVGINQLNEFAGPVATKSELSQMNGYLSNEIAKAADERLEKIVEIDKKLLEESQKSHD